ncbi:MAG TPA: nucleoside-diphosphate sugar epimerase/dehydratase [Chthonomonadales bacterium]|nr:nucleoside-diphosphate sugar epimerase/dehydratase [Chthonomonadales bacterium]
MPRSVLNRVLRPIRAVLPRLRNRHFIALDIVLLSLTPWLAFLLRYDGVVEIRTHAAELAFYTLTAVVVRVALFHPFGLYNRYWHYAGVDELVQTTLAVVSSMVVLYALYAGGVFHLAGDETLPRTLLLIDGLLALLVVGMTRFSVRLSRVAALPSRPTDAGRSVLIVGAGIVGQMVAREMKVSPHMGMRGVAFLDDDPDKQHLRIAGLPVLGCSESLPEVVASLGIEQVVIAMPNAPGKVVRRVVDLCEQAGVKARTVPGVFTLLDEKVRVNAIRAVDIDDLLRREPVRTDVEAVAKLLRGARVLITGGGGSIGSELCRQVLRCAPAELVVLGHGENSVFEIHGELARALRRPPPRDGSVPPERPSTRIVPVIADIRDEERMRRVLRQYRPQIVFHAAAHKHVPLMEANPAEAIANNVFGTLYLLHAAAAAGVEHFVMISTDKAVNPTSIMGATKRAAELLVLQAAERTGRPYVSVRFGNVLGSRGSVVPIFRRQIAEGGPVTVSHPEMTRYFMTIPEAVQLVLQSAVLGKGGEVFMLDMGEPVLIVDLARDMIELSGLHVGRDIDIEFTGIRPGEKLFEELRLDGESYQRTRHEKVLVVRNGATGTTDGIDDALSVMRAAVLSAEREAALAALKRLVPEFVPDEERLAQALTGPGAGVEDAVRRGPTGARAAPAPGSGLTA